MHLKDPKDLMVPMVQCSQLGPKDLLAQKVHWVPSHQLGPKDLMVRSDQKDQLHLLLQWRLTGQKVRLPP